MHRSFLVACSDVRAEPAPRAGRSGAAPPAYPPASVQRRPPAEVCDERALRVRDMRPDQRQNVIGADR